MAAKTPQCLFPFYTIGLALGDEPTLAPYSAEDAALDDLLAETLEQLILVFIRSQNYACHVLTPSRVYDSFGHLSQTGYILIVWRNPVNGRFKRCVGCRLAVGGCRFITVPFSRDARGAGYRIDAQPRSKGAWTRRVYPGVTAPPPRKGCLRES